MKALVTKINCLPIVKAHILTLVDASQSSDKVFRFDVATFYGIPIVGASILGYYVVPSDSLINVLITSLSVFAALLFNLLMLVLGVIDKRKGNQNFILLQRETYANIAYAVLISLFTVACLLIPYLFEFSKGSNAQKIYWGVIYFLLINFGLTMAMILKRMHAILVKLIDYPS